MLNILRYYALLSLLILILSGCDDNYISSIPNFPVYLRLNLASTYPTFRNNPGEHLIFKTPPTYGESVGYGGIIIYAGFDPDQYFAFDLACPVEADQKVKVAPNDNYGQVACVECGTVYNLTSGFGEAIANTKREPLKRYRANLNGDVLFVTYK